MSDIHGNAIALDAVLQDVRRNGIEHVLIAGDFVGYYYHADTVFELLSTWTWEGVQGNHDAIFVALSQGTDDVRSYRTQYGHALDLALQTLSAHDQKLLAALPITREYTRDGQHILLCHGSPWQQDAYVYPNAQPEIFMRIARLGYDVVVLGHTHYPFTRREGTTLIVNPGSVGQPRDVGGLASWAILDPLKMTATNRRVRFDPSSTIADVQVHDPELPYLTEVFTRRQRPYAA